MLVVIVLTGLTLGMGARYLNPRIPPLRVAGEMVEGSLKQARASAMVSTSAHRVRSVGTDSFIVESAPTCYDETWDIDAALSASLPEGVDFQGDAWSLCFNSRGIASSQLTITLANDDGEDRRLEILRGGILRVVE